MTPRKLAPEMLEAAHYVLEPRVKIDDDRYDLVQTQRQGNECAENTARRILREHIAALEAENESIRNPKPMQEQPTK